MRIVKERSGMRIVKVRACNRAATRGDDKVQSMPLFASQFRACARRGTASAMAAQEKQYAACQALVSATPPHTHSATALSDLWQRVRVCGAGAPVLQMIRVRSAFQIADVNSDHALDPKEFHKV